MEEPIIQAIVDLFVPLLMKLGFSESVSRLFSVLLTVALLFVLYYLCKYLYNRWKNQQTANDLAPFWEYPDIQKARQYFIPTQLQNIAPNREEEEPGDSKPYVAKEKMIPFFLHKVFNDKEKSRKYHLVLAGSGMGKTTFMLNLYVRYHSFWSWHPKKFKIRLFPFRDKRILEEIKTIGKEDALNTILLLDAFDEDVHLLQLHNNTELTESERFRKRLDEVMEAVQDFRRVIITSRTQYFPEIEDKHYELKIPRHDGGGYHKLGILYISPFDQKEVKQYLRKKYGIVRFWNWKQKRKALQIITLQIINRSPNLMVRPMLLSYIDLLVTSKKEFHNTYEIYETLVEKWLDRETIRQPEAKQNQFKKDLLQFSRLVALELYYKGSTSLDRQAAIDIAPKHQLQLKNYEMTGKSLLTRDGNGNWKFAHKSILEYFIAKEALENEAFVGTIDWTGWDMAEKFFNEVFFGKLGLEMVFVEGGSFDMGSNKMDREKPIHKVTVPSFSMAQYPVTQKQWTAVMGDNPSHFKGENLPVENVSWEDAQKFIEKLNQKTGKKFRLPTEAEWEFAARGGNKSKGYEYAGSNKLEEVGWFDKNSKQQTQEVGLLKPNELDIYDMSGNVWEWCEDDYHENYDNAPDDGSAWIDESRNSSRVLRGGGWSFNSVYCRVAYRDRNSPYSRYSSFGFRLAYSL
ncbi:MAG: SUMF1/EgtB/PvdO family nonheme iron enzyme [Chitinophagales bacterium]